MARRSKSSGDGAGVLIIILVVFAGVLACFVPLWWLWTEASTAGGPPKPAGDPEPDEIGRGRRLAARIAMHEDEVSGKRDELSRVTRRHEDRIAAIGAEADEAGCRERSDGLYDERRTVAVGMNRRLLRARSERDEAVGEARRALSSAEYARERDVDELRSIADAPADRVAEWFEGHRARLRDVYTARGAMVGLLLGAVGVMSLLSGSEQTDGAGLVAAAAIAAVPTGIVVALGAWIGRSVADPSCPPAADRQAVLAMILSGEAEAADEPSVEAAGARRG